MVWMHCIFNDDSEFEKGLITGHRVTVIGVLIGNMVWQEMHEYYNEFLRLV